MKNNESQMIAVSEYMRIRRYVMNLLYRAQDDKIRIPSLKELSDQFQVSRPTACKALKELIAEGFLTAKPGLGTFANPSYLWKETGIKPMPLIGILYGNGLNVHYDLFVGQLVGELLSQLVRIPTTVHLLNFSSTDIEQVKQTIMLEQLDGLCWHNPPENFLPIIEQLRQEGLPVVTGGGFSHSNVQFDFETIGYECGRELLKEKRKNIIFLYNRSPHRRAVEGLKRAFKEAGIELNERLFLEQSANVTGEIRRIFELGVPVDAIFNPYMPYPEIAALLADLRVDTKKDCRIIQNTLCLYGADLPVGLLYDIPLTEYVSSMVKILKQHLNNEPVTNVQEMIKIPLKNNFL